MITTIGVFTSHATAEKVLQDLRDFKVSEKDISYLYTNDEGEVKDGQTGEKVTSAAVTGVTTGAVIGGIAGLVLANGIIPGFGSLVIAGPLAQALGVTGATALVGAGAAGAVGSLIGALTHIGVADKDVELYEEQVRKGGVLVIARTDEISTKAIFEKNGGKDIQEYN